jgi:hypothetical protein
VRGGNGCGKHEAGEWGHILVRLVPEARGIEVIQPLLQAVADIKVDWQRDCAAHSKVEHREFLA